MRYHAWTMHDAASWTALANSFVPMDQHYREPDGWSASLSVQDSGSYRLLQWAQHRDRIAHRTLSQVRQVPGHDTYWVVVPRQGSYHTVHGEVGTHAAPGSAAVMGLDHACRIIIPRSVAHAMQVPRAVVDDCVQPARPLRAVLDLNSGLGRITSDLVDSVHAQRANLSAREFNAACDRLTELLCMLLVGDLTPQDSHLADVTEQVRHYVRRHLGRSDVHLEAVARAVGWSARQIRRALGHSGTTFRELRQEEALRAARDRLCDPKDRDLSISEIAAASGFTATWFSAAFKQRYGTSPRDFRRIRAS